MHSTTHQEEMIVLSFIEKNRMVTPPQKIFEYVKRNGNVQFYN